MNKIVNKIMIIVTLVFVLFSCESKEPEVFSEPSSVRMKNVIDDYNSTLQGADGGWLFEYFPHGKLIYGGYNFYITFSEGKATVMSELSAGKTETSDYVVKSSAGPVLSFNTFNAIMHYFAVPWNTKEGYQGRKGDFEFVLMGKEENQINLEGVRTGNKMRLIKLSVPKEEYDQKVQKISTLIDENVLQLTVNGEDIRIVSKSNRNLSVTYENEKKEIVNTLFPYLVTNKGIKFYRSYKIKDTEFYELTLDEAGNKFVTEDGKTVIRILQPPYEYRGDWFSEKDKERSASFEAQWTQLVTNFEGTQIKAWGYTLDTSKFYLGKNPINAGTAVTFVISNSKGKAYGVCGMTFSLVSGHEDQIAIKKGQGIKNWQFFDAFTKDFVDALQNKSPYTVVPDDKDNPTKVKLTSVADSNYWFTLYVNK